MRRELRTVLERTRQPEQIRELIRANFGPAALDAAMEQEEPVAAAEPEPDAGAAAPAGDGGAGSLQLDSKVLGTGQGGPRLNIGDGSRLNLGGTRDPGGYRLRLGD